MLKTCEKMMLGDSLNFYKSDFKVITLWQESSETLKIKKVCVLGSYFTYLPWILKTNYLYYFECSWEFLPQTQFADRILDKIAMQSMRPFQDWSDCCKGSNNIMYEILKSNTYNSPAG